MDSTPIVKHHLPAPRHAGTRSGSRTCRTSSLLGIDVMNRPATSQYRWRGVCWRRVSVAVVSAIGGLQLPGPPPSRSWKEQP